MIVNKLKIQNNKQIPVIMRLIKENLQSFLSSTRKNKTKHEIGFKKIKKKIVNKLKTSFKSFVMEFNLKYQS